MKEESSNILGTGIGIHKSGVDSVIAEILPEDIQADSFSEVLEYLERHFRDMNYIGPRANANFMDSSAVRPQAYAIIQKFLRKAKRSVPHMGR